MKYIIITSVALVALYACGVKNNEENAVYKNVSSEKFNRTIDTAAFHKEAWVHDPTQIILKYLEDLTLSKKRNITIEVLNPGEVADTVEVTVQDEGLRDDSLAGEIRKFTLERRNGVWHILALKKCWKCQEGRGPSTYDTIPCH